MLSIKKTELRSLSIPVIDKTAETPFCHDNLPCWCKVVGWTILGALALASLVAQAIVMVGLFMGLVIYAPGDICGDEKGLISNTNGQSFRSIFSHRGQGWLKYFSMRIKRREFENRSGA